MTKGEVLKLVAYVKQGAPQQRFDEFTPDVWADLLGDLDFVDSLEGVKKVLRRQPFVSPAEIRAEVETIRKNRLDLAKIPAPPDPDNTVRYQGDVRQMIAEMMSGQKEFREIRELQAAPTRRLTPQESAEMRAKVSGQGPEFHRLRLSSQTVDCDFCAARRGEVCATGDGAALTASPAHRSRLVKAGEAAPHRGATLEDFKALLASQGVVVEDAVEAG